MITNNNPSRQHRRTSRIHHILTVKTSGIALFQKSPKIRIRDGDVLGGAYSG
jgi:hypothetical protein